jgi:hypothetical protein
MVWVVAAISLALGAVLACGNSKPPLTPDGAENQLPPDIDDAGAPAPASSAPHPK